MSHESHLSSKQLKVLQQSLLSMKKDLEERMTQSNYMGLQNSMRDGTGELSTNDNHPGDLGTEMYERGKDIALLENEERRLARVKEALEQMDHGDYGICHECSKPIPYARLLAIPYTLYCVQHSKEQEVSNHRPIEEQFLNPPFGRTSMDDQPDQNGFDGEDAWQIVESWGSSNTPAMADDNNIEDYEDMAIEASDELDGFVESYESFIATDIFGKNVSVVRNKQYHKYLAEQEGDPLLEPDLVVDED